MLVKLKPWFSLTLAYASDARNKLSCYSLARMFDYNAVNNSINFTCDLEKVYYRILFQYIRPFCRPDTCLCY